MGEHARLSPSDTGWPYCPGKINACRDYTDTANKFSIDGTGDHCLLELVLGEDNPDPQLYLGQTIHAEPGTQAALDAPDGWECTQERINRVKVAVDYVQMRLGKLPNAKLMLERRIDIGREYGRNDWWGTVDLTLLHNEVLELADYKGGFKLVMPSTPQLKSYAVGTYNDALRQGYNPKHVKLTIIQPKVNDPIRSIVVTPDEVKAWGVELAEAAKLTDDPDAPLIPGEWCEKSYCLHRFNCPERQKSVAEVTGLDVPTPDKMTNDQIQRVLDAIPALEAFVEGVQKEAEKRLEDGADLGDWSLVNGRAGHPKWTDEEAAAKALAGMRIGKADRVTEKLITPTQALKLDLTDRQIKKLESLIERPEPSKKLKKVKKEAKDLFNVPEIVQTKKVLLPTENAVTTLEEYYKAGWTKELLIQHNIFKES